MTVQEVDAETTPLRDPWAYQYEIDVAEVAEVWRRGTVISSWLVDLMADALARSPQLDGFAGRVSDSGEGRWTVIAAVDEGVPAPVITASLIQRFESARARHIHRQGSLGHAKRVRRPCGEACLSAQAPTRLQCSRLERVTRTRTAGPVDPPSGAGQVYCRP